ncbi:hypothetical protein ACFFX0_11965 [Citricoccus parietis]|uniref:Uncharacterized protein n=1 Tax=Citricoccus parietis TaxID=592307 RepID=A0ABV5FYW8_9MICC
MGPTRPRTVPGSTAKPTSFRTVTPPKWRLTSANVKRAAMCPLTLPVRGEGGHHSRGSSADGSGRRGVIQITTASGLDRRRIRAGLPTILVAISGTVPFS